MEAFLVACCLLTGATSVVALLRAVIKTEGLSAALCVLLAGCMAVATGLLLALIVRGL